MSALLAAAADDPSRTINGLSCALGAVIIGCALAVLGRRKP